MMLVAPVVAGETLGLLAKRSEIILVCALKKWGHHNPTKMFSKYTWHIWYGLISTYNWQIMSLPLPVESPRWSLPFERFCSVHLELHGRPLIFRHRPDYHVRPPSVNQTSKLNGMSTSIILKGPKSFVNFIVSKMNKEICALSINFDSCLLPYCFSPVFSPSLNSIS